MRKLLVPVILLALIQIVIISCKRDKCKEQYCMNGGACHEGTCKCPDAYYGEHCEEYRGYQCVSGVCKEVTSGTGPYKSLGECQSQCGNPKPGPQPDGYGSVTYKNNSQTKMNITVNNVSRVINPGGTTTFTGTPGNKATGNASTSGESNGGSQVGLLISWQLNDDFPGEGATSVINLNIGTDYFFLKMTNTSSSTYENLYVNYGLLSQTNDNIVIPNDGVTYSLGYYKAFTNGNVRIYKEGSTTAYAYWNQGTNYTLPGTTNQVVSLTLSQGNFAP